MNIWLVKLPTDSDEEVFLYIFQMKKWSYILFRLLPKAGWCLDFVKTYYKGSLVFTQWYDGSNYLKLYIIYLYITTKNKKVENANYHRRTYKTGLWILSG